MGHREESRFPGKGPDQASEGSGNMRAPDTWRHVLSSVKSIVTADDYNKWISDLRFIAEVEGQILVATPDRLSLDRVNADHKHMLQRVWRSADPKNRALRIACWKELGPDVRDFVEDPWAVVEEDVVEAAEIAAEAAEPEIVGTAPHMTFETLITGPSNNTAAKLAGRIASGARGLPNVMLIYGVQGTGKTHILRAIENEARKRKDTRRISYLTAEEFLVAYVQGARAGDTSALKTLVRDNELLLVDDLQWIAGATKTDDEFFATLRTLTARGGQLVLTADAAPGDLKGFSPRLISEIKGAACVEVGLPDDDMRRGIVRQHADILREDTPTFVITDEMIDQIVTHVRGPGRELCGVLWSLQSETGYGDIAPTLDMVELIIRRHEGERQPPSLDVVKRAAMRVAGVTKAEIEGPSKVRSVCVPRQIAMYLSREMTQKSFPQIAKVFGNRDHTTVLHAYRTIEKKLLTDEDLARAVERVRDMVFEMQSSNG